MHVRHLFVAAVLTAVLPGCYLAHERPVLSDSGPALTGDAGLYVLDASVLPDAAPALPDAWIPPLPDSGTEERLLRADLVDESHSYIYPALTDNLYHMQSIVVHGASDEDVILSSITVMGATDSHIFTFAGVRSGSETSFRGTADSLAPAGTRIALDPPISVPARTDVTLEIVGRLQPFVLGGYEAGTSPVRSGMLASISWTGGVRPDLYVELTAEARGASSGLRYAVIGGYGSWIGAPMHDVRASRIIIEQVGGDSGRAGDGHHVSLMSLHVSVEGPSAGLKKLTFFVRRQGGLLSVGSYRIEIDGLPVSASAVVFDSLDYDVNTILLSAVFPDEITVDAATAHTVSLLADIGGLDAGESVSTRLYSTTMGMATLATGTIRAAHADDYGVAIPGMHVSMDGTLIPSGIIWSDHSDPDHFADPSAASDWIDEHQLNLDLTVSHEIVP